MRWIGSPDSYKAKECRKAANAVDWAAILVGIEAEAEAVKAAGGRPRRVEARLESLRVQYRAALRQKHFAETGVNLLHIGLVD